MRRFEDLGCVVEEYAPDLGEIEEAFMILRAQHFVVDRELHLRDHRRPAQSRTSSGTPKKASRNLPPNSPGLTENGLRFTVA